MTEGPNEKLLLDALDWATREAAKPEIDREWDQSSWTQDADYRVQNLAHEAASDEFAARGDVWNWREFTVNPEAGYEWENRFEARVEQIAENIRATSACGSSYCIAGYVGKVTGYDFSQGDVSVGSWARDKLGISGPQAGALFDGDNDIDSVTHVVKMILDGEQFDD